LVIATDKMAGIYIHIPFCKKLCNYCDFYHLVSPGDHSVFIKALSEEIQLRKDYLEDEIISTIYFGGGTPSVLSADDLSFILESIRRVFKVDENNEVTIELNPDDVNPAYMKHLKDTGINRISLGIQSWRDQDLVMLNRRHDSKGARKALEDVLNTGFENVTIDLIYGIPGMNNSDWAANLDTAFSYDIKHLSAYHLTIEPATVFGKMKKKGLLTEIEEDESNLQFHTLIEKSENAGFIHYEISNFGRSGYFSVHNMNYWRQVNYIGLGPSAHSFNGYSRQWNPPDLRKYIRSIKQKEPSFEREFLDLKTRYNEYIMISLRTMWGIDLDYVEKVFEKEGYDYVVNIAGKFINYGLLKYDKKNLVLTNQGKMISDNIISEFMMPAND
jgi:oxygen-independent coproporphyrinogen III oxidase